MKGAIRLDLCADLTELPEAVFSLADSLEILNLTGNQLTSLPDHLPSLRKLRILFCSENQFETLPPVLGRCEQLCIVGFKSNGITQVPPESLPKQLRWLILTNNQIAHIPETISECKRLQKLMLSGNSLTALPEGIARCNNLELLRIAANQIRILPEGLFDLPKLAWLAASDNPLHDTDDTRTSPLPEIPWHELRIKDRLGEGASGVIMSGEWKGTPVAVKLFKSAVTSDGLPKSELQAFISAGAHPNLIPLLGPIDGHPDGASGLVMNLLPESCSILAQPPNLDTCTRDVYPDGFHLSPNEVMALARQIALVGSHLHRRGISHGDLYAHNIAWNKSGDCFLNDFGAATILPKEDASARDRLHRIEVLAYGRLIGELIQHTDTKAAEMLKDLHRRCVDPVSARRPLFGEICDILEYLIP